ncbi:MAG: 16S rRNA (cytidine(1402)-2'-O)-methyltransferase [Candidatus Moranbacteria bacterium CG_4_9_14_3_um_filter_42_9]|nr:MAG: 16S rRNA (cytidine(1402)-2'-O)-methyltransferase [Candidatus Moranbacteria bacterium CG_4_9_14_3_um_filter_42_9]
MNTGVLYIVATPIGNLEDITFRAVRTLKEADLIACEDTRVTKKMLDRYDIKKPLISYFQHSKLAKVSQIMEIMKTGKNVALVTDAGTPGISDPGNMLVEESLKNDIPVIPIPGPSGLTTLASVAGIDMQKLLFLGFPPHKKGRETFFKEVITSEYPVIYFDSVYRVIKNLELLRSLATGKKIILGRELTKMFEEILRGSVEEILEYFEKNKGKVKGEFVIIVC